MAKITLSAATWVCVNPGAAYSSGVEITINVGKTTANLRYEFKDSDTTAPTSINDISEPVQSLSVKAVDGKGFLWLISQSVDVDVQIETITPATSVVSVPSNLAKETKQDDQITELQLSNELAYREATKTYTTLKTWAQYKVVDITGWSVGVVVGDFVYKEIDKITNSLQWIKSDGVTTISAPPNEDVNVDQLTGDREISVVYSSVFGAVSKTRTPTIKNGIYNFGTVETEGDWV
jgi:hypothetical protein